MSLVVEFAVESPILRDARRAVPDMEFQIEDVRQMPDGEHEYAFWADGDDFEAFEEAVAADPTATDYTRLVDVGDRRLYRATLSKSAAEWTTRSVAAKHDVTVLDVTADDTESRVQARVPDRAALVAYRDAFRERDLTFRLLGVYDREDDPTDGKRYGITAPQREALVRALEAGYFDVPRRTTLSKLADDLGISEQVLSARLRRGQTNLVRNALETGGDADAST
ncbi:helix-turn-helix domain-containing protein [Halorussus lipolyticus]|uniref:helix-turn-helix domain-containing protein n=1 Tax=Halorussus lipolyticus TaxID=3034024 RepID=UPI0023E7F9DC|nr:helix-turn-helix domain-containing protein [Halorussus sp. DT80]